jgi:hypothetical protein
MTLNNGKRGNRNWVWDVQESFFWSGVVSFIFIFTFDLGFVKEALGSYILLGKAINTAVCWFCFIVGSRKTLSMFGQFTRFFTMLKKGTEPETGRLKESEE